MRHWKSDKAGPPAARWARRNLGLLGALNLVFVVAFAAILAAGLSDLIFALPKGLYAVLTLPLIGLALTALAAVLAVRVWREGVLDARRAPVPHRRSGGGDRLRLVPELLEPAGLPDRIEAAHHFFFRVTRAWLARSSSRPGASSYQRGPERYSFSVCRRRARARLGAISAQARAMALRSAIGAT